MTEPVRVEVKTASPYPVVIGRGLLGDLVAEFDGARTVAIFHQPPLAETAEAVRAALAEKGIDATVSRSPMPRTARILLWRASAGTCSAGSA